MTEPESAVVNAVIAGLSKDVDSLTAERDALKADVQHLLDTCVPVPELREVEAERDALKVERDELRKAISPALYASTAPAHHLAWCALAEAHASDSESMDRFDELEAQLVAGDTARAALREALEWALAYVEQRLDGESIFANAKAIDKLATVRKLLASSPPEREI